MDIVKDVAAIMKKYNRDWRIKIDNLFIKVWIRPYGDLDYSDNECLDKWIKVTFEHWMFDEPYLSLRQCKKMYKEYKKKQYDFMGLELKDMEVIIDVMKYFKNNYRKIKETVDTYYDFKGGD